MNANLQHRDRITAVVDGEEVEIYNWVNIKQPAVIRGGNPSVEKFQAEIGRGDARETPEYITHWVAEELDWAFGVDPSDHGITVVDPTDEDVQLV